MKRKVSAILLMLSCISFRLFSQEEEKKIITLNGYTSAMMTSMFEKLSDPFINDNLIHNRLNFKGYASENLTFAVELRNRLFTGDLVKTSPSYATMIGTDQGIVDLSWNLVNKQSFFLNTTIDRLYADLNLGKFQVRAGRQRINWGQTLVWNPNDIFNAYSYFDFDYIERPGSDAIRLQYYPNPMSAVEIAVKANSQNKITAAALYRFNKKGYDIQFLGGISDNTDLVAGAGWSGAIGSVSFRGEGTWFMPYENISDTTGTGLFTIGFDKFFNDGSMAQVQAMVCNKPVEFGNFNSLLTENMTAKDLAFSKFTAFASYSYPVTPLFTAGISAMWFPDLKGYFSGLSADYSAAENIDLSLLWQRFEGKFGPSRSTINIGFLRFKFSF
jgi:hypothetical protein